MKETQTQNSKKLLSKPIVLIGMPGSGKTTFGKILAKALNTGFIDIDAEIELVCKQSVSDIFKHQGESFFRQKEQEVLAQTLQNFSGVIATGGGSVVSEKNRESIKEYGIGIWLTASIDVLSNRVRANANRPLFHGQNIKSVLKDMYDHRKEYYAIADFCINTDDENAIDLAVGQVKKELSKIMEKKICTK